MNQFVLLLALGSGWGGGRGLAMAIRRVRWLCAASAKTEAVEVIIAHSRQNRHDAFNSRCAWRLITGPHTRQRGRKHATISRVTADQRKDPSKNCSTGVRAGDILTRSFDPAPDAARGVFVPFVRLPSGKRHPQNPFGYSIPRARSQATSADTAPLTTSHTSSGSSPLESNSGTLLYSVVSSARPGSFIFHRTASSSTLRRISVPPPVCE